MTRTGAGTLSAALVLGLLGAVLGYPLLIVLAVGAAVALLCAVVAVALRPDIELTREVGPDRVRVGEAAIGRVEVRNRSRWPSPGFTAVDRVDGEPVPVRFAPMAAGGRKVAHYPVPTPRRGVLSLGPLTVERQDPLGLLRRAQRRTGDEVLWVHPRVHLMRPLPVGRVLDYEGRVMENSRAGTVTFSTLREYRPGDDPRQIHWRSTARMGTLVVREHIDTTEPRTSVLLDTRLSIVDGDGFEQAVEVAASVLDAVQAIRRPVVLHILGEDEAEVAARGARTMPDRLAAAEQVDLGDTALMEAADRISPGGNLVVVTGAGDPLAVTRLADQRRRFGVVVVVALGQIASGPWRRSGSVVITARSAQEAAAAWNQAVAGGAL
ncbi:DUF58 domain-containing protein [Actinokineospora enzanensis]|uniref:DUF58 domain-containing protein n=1 Tax=Actinokineospora enzanensis TaxID=155975 RepID=UPI000371459F|nr:DUF58 domain-containing protein [Actinokineospora enzanensis]